MDRFNAEADRSRRIFDDVPRRKRSRRNPVIEMTKPECQAPPSSPAAPALAFVAIRLTRLRQDDVGLSVSSTGSCSSPGSSTGSNSVPAPVPALAPAGSRCS
ncbi:hypothetical protein ISN45_Aa04g015100 [Arabidopsis thaliana x Arabidopsis arenosa]|uniref:Uncharacterized protein n=1 Tax=Arabidopsis thaliana x Arabidopsis arenosa TaxID=1240361 RepID=A0A8T2A556_9BRAS|nr:hypothetical protein ISN45_Aa04g015100 [Arabidopsis thaliana x Arabidopsis arenosa]